MITCTRCGKKNEDSSPTCRQCGHKLQSGFARFNGASLSSKKNRDSLNISFENSDIYAKHGEAWIYALFLLAAVVFFTYQQVYWPLYILTPAVAILAWFRKI
ncbi:zinc-ribbon domain-containing protein [Maridesulfovibrio ferrireducens]|uniref:zinc-ribbon domain-containing protein n=1 Tax=Maridesulfovibrio ferrireducens TaxID=246191 RepID=UPI001A187EA7|nr:zinc-ribbon domain-containing protein [Maridesulfovibrio ferrireducens]